MGVGVGIRGSGTSAIEYRPPFCLPHFLSPLLFFPSSYGGIGGLSEALGWTDVQREDGAAVLGGPQKIINFAAAVAVLDSLWFLYTSGPALLDKFTGGQ